MVLTPAVIVFLLDSLLAAVASVFTTNIEDICLGPKGLLLPKIKACCLYDKLVTALKRDQPENLAQPEYSFIRSLVQINTTDRFITL